MERLNTYLFETAKDLKHCKLGIDKSGLMLIHLHFFEGLDWNLIPMIYVLGFHIYLKAHPDNYWLASTFVDPLWTEVLRVRPPLSKNLGIVPVNLLNSSKLLIVQFISH